MTHHQESDEGNTIARDATCPLSRVERGGSKSRGEDWEITIYFYVTTFYSADS